VDRFIKTLGLLIIMLFLLASGIEATLDRLASSSHQNQVAIYGPTNAPLLLYTGDLDRFAEVSRVDPSRMPRFLCRTRNYQPTPLPVDASSTWL